MAALALGEGADQRRVVPLTQALALRIGRYLAGDALEAGPMEQFLGSSITYRIAVGPRQGRKVLTLQTPPASDESFDGGVGKVAEFSLRQRSGGCSTDSDHPVGTTLVCAASVAAGVAAGPVAGKC